MNDWNNVLDWLAKAFIGVVISQGVRILSEMKKSVDKLNVQVGQIIERTEWHSKEIDKLDTRVNRLEVRGGHGTQSKSTQPASGAGQIRRDP